MEAPEDSDNVQPDVGQVVTAQDGIPLREELFHLRQF